MCEDAQQKAHAHGIQHSRIIITPHTAPVYSLILTENCAIIRVVGWDDIEDDRATLKMLVWKSGDINDVIENILYGTENYTEESVHVKLGTLEGWMF